MTAPDGQQPTLPVDARSCSLTLQGATHGMGGKLPPDRNTPPPAGGVRSSALSLGSTGRGRREPSRVLYRSVYRCLLHRAPERSERQVAAGIGGPLLIGAAICLNRIDPMHAGRCIDRCIGGTVVRSAATGLRG